MRLTFACQVCRAAEERQGAGRGEGSGVFVGDGGWSRAGQARPSWRGRGGHFGVLNPLRYVCEVGGIAGGIARCG